MDKSFRGLLSKMLEGKKKPSVFQSTQSVGGKRYTQSAVNWREITPTSEPGRLEKLYVAWEGDHDDWSGFTSWDRMARATGLLVEDLAAELKTLQQKNPEGIGVSVDRLGNFTYFKFKVKPEFT